MPSSKKKRDRKNKEAKSASNAADGNKRGVRGGVRTVAISAGVPDAAMYERCFIKNMKDVPPADVVERVCQGMGLTTHLLTDHLTYGGPEGKQGKQGLAHAKYLKRLVDAELVPTVLSLLNRCEGETFEDVVEVEMKVMGISPGGRGIIPFYPEEQMESAVAAPGVWVALLNNIVSAEGLGSEKLDQLRMDVVTDFIPLVRCMCDDMKRELFLSTRDWYSAIRPFVQLVFGLSETFETIPLLLGHEGLRELMVGCVFWGVHRPDIIEDAEPYKEIMGPDAFPSMADFAGAFLQRAMKSFEREGENKFYFEGEGKVLVKQIGTTLCGGREGGIFVSGLIQLLNGDSTSEILANANFLDKGSIRAMLTMLVVSGCVDREFIDEVVDLGLNHTFTSDDAAAVTKIALEMAHDFDNLLSKLTPKDRFVAAAIDAGLVDMLLKFIGQYGATVPTAAPGCNISMESAAHDFMFNVYMNVQAINGVMMSKHSSKAIDSCRSRVLAQLQSPDIEALRNHGMCKMILQMLDSIFRDDVTRGGTSQDTSNDACANCMKMLRKSEVRCCARCKLIKYCSKDCQVAHWKTEHKRACKYVRNAKKVGTPREKVVEMGRKFEEVNAETVVEEMTLRGYDVLGCVVMVNFVTSPPVVSVELIDDHFGTKVGQARQYRAMIAQAGECLGFFFSFADGSYIKHTMVFPNDWAQIQARVRHQLAFQLELCKNDPKLRDDLIKEVRKRYTL